MLPRPRRKLTRTPAKPKAGDKPRRMMAQLLAKTDTKPPTTGGWWPTLGDMLHRAFIGAFGVVSDEEEEGAIRQAMRLAFGTGFAKGQLYAQQQTWLQFDSATELPDNITIEIFIPAISFLAARDPARESTPPKIAEHKLRDIHCWARRSQNQWWLRDPGGDPRSTEELLAAGTLWRPLSPPIDPAEKPSP